MRKFVVLFLAGCAVFSAAQAKIWRVNNNTGVVADFTTVQAAHNAASAGDTIHLEPSINGYGDLTMSKRLVIISTGQFVNENPGLQFDPKLGTLGGVNINNTAANNSILMVRFSGNISINSGVSNISLISCGATNPNGNTQCAAGQLVINNADNIIARGCWFSNIQMDNGSNNIVIVNNIVGNTIRNDVSSDAVISNNVIHAMGGGPCGPNDGTLHNCTIGNNIFNERQNSGFFNCNLSNNIAPSGNLPAGNGNLVNVDMSTVFINSAGGFVDNVYQLKPGSPAIGAGGGGVDCGSFGGTSPFRLGMQPPVPSITKLSLPATPSGNSMTVTFSTRSN